MNKRIKLSNNGPEFSRIVSGFWKLGAGNAELSFSEREELIEKAFIESRNKELLKLLDENRLTKAEFEILNQYYSL